MTFAEYLAAHFRVRPWARRALAHKLGVHPITVSWWLAGTSLPTAQVQAHVMDALGRWAEISVV